MELTAFGAMESISFAETALDAAGITFLAVASATFFIGTDMIFLLTIQIDGQLID